VTPEAVIHFPPFRLDCTNEQLWHGNQLLPLRPKPFAVLHYLVEHPNRLVTREELLKAVWPETYVSLGVLHAYIRDLRAVLGDDPQAPRFIETVARRGYRFIAPLTTTQSVRGSESGVRSLQSPTPSTQHPAPTLVGRETELAQLQGWLEQALNGERQVVFVTGEPGIGKTTLVEAFLQQIQEARGWRLETGSSSPQASSLKTQVSSLWIGRGQCIEQYGPGEAYLPVLEALGRVCRVPGGEHLVAVLRHHAPTWLVQMPALVSEPELDALQRTV
jgi:DNA-binding winged helix-turn-helix (wHTH) protein